VSQTGQFTATFLGFIDGRRFLVIFLCLLFDNEPLQLVTGKAEIDTAARLSEADGRLILHDCLFTTIFPLDFTEVCRLGQRK
jgi:hypothetical protein